MTRQIRKVAVLGAGVMGSGIAGHLANAGIPSLMFDLKRPHAALKAMLKQKPAPLHHPSLLSMIEPCDYEQDSGRLAECDWIVEVVTERLDIKKRVFENVRTHARPDAIITSNTSGIPIAAMTEGTDAEFKQRFFVTHFFNPVRYMKLLELVPGEETDADLFSWFCQWGEEVLGKGIVVGKDTPNFVANRIGTYGMMALLHRVQGTDWTVEQIDKIFGKPMGRPKSAVFRTGDVVGLDTLAHVSQNCFDSLTEDPQRDAFKIPALLQSLIDEGNLGSKTGAGFYKKAKIDGKKVILSRDLNTGEYTPQEKVRFDSLGAVRSIEDVGARVKAFLAHGDAASQLGWQATADTLLYSAQLLGEIADDVVNVDNALRWGFGWDLGPFQTWDAIGLAESVERMRAEGRAIPAIVDEAVAAGGWYERSGGQTRWFDVLGDKERKPVPQPAGAVVLADLKEAGKVVQTNDEATLIDLGDGVLGLEFHSKMNAVGPDLIKQYNNGLDLLEASDDWQALVVGNDDPRAFSAGANLMLVFMAAQSGQFDQIEALTKGMQDTLMRAKHSSKPVVTAPHSLVLGGGAEVAMQASAAVATGELYMGLVEVGVGLLPGAGGCKEVVWRLVGTVPEGVNVDTFQFIQKAFMQIGMAQTSTSSEEARAMGYLRPTDLVSMNRDLQIGDAKTLALGLAGAHFRPPAKKALKLPGRNGTAAIQTALANMVLAGQISEYDAHIGKKIAHVINGGDVSQNTAVSEQHVLDLEREAFLSLCGEEKTQARIQHMLMNNKPLRN